MADAPHMDAVRTIVEPFEPSGLVVTPNGDLDVATAPALREMLRQALDAGTVRLVFDLRAVTFMDSIGLAAILGAGRQLDDGCLAMVLAPDSYPSLIADVAGLRHCVTCVATREQALASVAGDLG